MELTASNDWYIKLPSQPIYTFSNLCSFSCFFYSLQLRSLVPPQTAHHQHHSQHHQSDALRPIEAIASSTQSNLTATSPDPSAPTIAQPQPQCHGRPATTATATTAAVVHDHNNDDHIEPRRRKAPSRAARSQHQARSGRTHCFTSQGKNISIRMRIFLFFFFVRSGRFDCYQDKILFVCLWILRK